MVAWALTGNISGEATTPLGNILGEAMRQVMRGVTVPRKLDGIYRPMHPKPGERSRFSTHMRRRADAVEAELRSGGLKIEPGKATLVATRRQIEQGWRAVSEILVSQGQRGLAADVRKFVLEMPPAMTEKEFIAARWAKPTRAREGSPR